jgi:hypothetical protein
LIDETSGGLFLFNNKKKNGGLSLSPPKNSSSISGLCHRAMSVCDEMFRLQIAILKEKLENS